MSLRIFDVYGPDLKTGTVHSFLTQARDEHQITLHGKGYQTRTFLHQDDFLTAFDGMLKAYLEGATGIYNVGSPEEISLKRLADSCWQLTHKNSDTKIKHEPAPKDLRWWVLPDITRMRAVANWSPRVSLRNGLWRMNHE